MIRDKEEKWTELCYVAGPYRAQSEYYVKLNIRRAEDVGVELWAAGWVPIVPHLNTRFFGGAYGLPDNVWLKGDFAIIKACKFIVVILGWRFSSGTRREIEVAHQAGIHVYYWEKEEDRSFLKNYYEDWRD